MMNIYKKELQFHYKSSLFWLLGIVFLVGTAMLKYGALNAGNEANLQNVTNMVPDIVQAIYGMNGLDIVSLSGYFGVVINFLMLILSLYGLLLGLSHVNHEVKNKTIEFIFVKPVTKKHILFNKIWAGFTLIWLMHLIMFVVIVISVQSQGAIDDSIIFRTCIGLFAMNIFFYGLGVFFSTLKTYITPSFVGLMVLFALYLMAIFSRVVDGLSFLEHITPFEFLSGEHVVGDFSFIGVIVMIILACVSIVISWNMINKFEYK